MMSLISFFLRNSSRSLFIFLFSFKYFSNNLGAMDYFIMLSDIPSFCSIFCGFFCCLNLAFSLLNETELIGYFILVNYWNWAEKIKVLLFCTYGVLFICPALLFIYFYFFLVSLFFLDLKWKFDKLICVWLIVSVMKWKENEYKIGQFAKQRRELKCRLVLDVCVCVYV